MIKSRRLHKRRTLWERNSLDRLRFKVVGIDGNPHLALKWRQARTQPQETVRVIEEARLISLDESGGASFVVTKERKS